MSDQPAKIHVDPARAYALAEMTPYQDGAVVSRTLLQHDTGTLTVFSFDAGQALSEHTVPYEVPFWIDDLKRHFPRLEDLAVPMHRFGQFLHPAMAEGTCAVSETLSHHLMQLPCHQDLSDDDIRQIAARVRLVLES